MPITGIGSYVPTMRDFRLHWDSVNQQIDTPGLVLPGNYTLQDFTDDETAVTQAIISVTTKATAARTQAAQLEMAREAIRQRAMQFRMAVELNLSGTRFGGRVPETPKSSSIETKFMAPLDAMSELWAEIDAATGLPNFTPPLLLPGNYQRSQFNTERAALTTTFAQTATAEREVTARRAYRDTLLTPIYDRMKQYRTAVVLALPAGDPLLATVPRLTPPPGTTPPGLVVTGAWDAALVKARFTWPLSTYANLDKLQVRACTGGSYKAGDEEIVADLAADATHYETDWGLTVPGALATFKIYVMATTGNENGGKAIKIVRPTT